MDIEDRLPRIVATHWEGRLPVEQGYYDRERREPRPGMQGFGTPAHAVIWYSEDDDAVMVHCKHGLPASERSRIDRAVTALRVLVATWA